jgi:hypothetical protein
LKNDNALLREKGWDAWAKLQDERMVHRFTYADDKTNSAMVESRCGILCSDCTYKESHGCSGCVNMEKPFWGECDVKICCEKKGLEHCGECPDIPCEILTGMSFSGDEHADNGKRIEQCKKWHDRNQRKGGKK